MAIGPTVLGHTLATLKTVLLGFAVFLIGAAGEQPNERMARVHEVGLARLAAAIACGSSTTSAPARPAT